MRPVKLNQVMCGPTLRVDIYSETLPLQRCGAERAFDRCPSLGVTRSLVSSVAKNVRTRNDPRRRRSRRRATGGRGTKRNESEGRQRRRREGTTEKGLPTASAGGRMSRLAGGRAGAGRAREREGGASRRASPSSPLSREGTKAREGVS